MFCTIVRPGVTRSCQLWIGSFNADALPPPRFVKPVSALSHMARFEVAGTVSVGLVTLITWVATWLSEGVAVTVTVFGPSVVPVNVKLAVKGNPGPKFNTDGDTAMELSLEVTVNVIATDGVVDNDTPTVACRPAPNRSTAIVPGATDTDGAPTTAFLGFATFK